MVWPALLDQTSSAFEPFSLSEVQTRQLVRSLQALLPSAYRALNVCDHQALGAADASDVAGAASADTAAVGVIAAQSYAAGRRMQGFRSCSCMTATTN